jgi:hypothetical protein
MNSKFVALEARYRQDLDLMKPSLNGDPTRGGGGTDDAMKMKMLEMKLMNERRSKAQLESRRKILVCKDWMRAKSPIPHDRVLQKKSETILQKNRRTFRNLN